MAVDQMYRKDAASSYRRMIELIYRTIEYTRSKATLCHSLSRARAAQGSIQTSFLSHPIAQTFRSKFHKASFALLTNLMGTSKRRLSCADCEPQESDLLDGRADWTSIHRIYVKSWSSLPLVQDPRCICQCPTTCNSFPVQEGRCKTKKIRPCRLPQ